MGSVGVESSHDAPLAKVETNGVVMVINTAKIITIHTDRNGSG